MEKKIVAFIFLTPFLLHFSFAQNKPIAESAADMVDLFTGDFVYSVPLLTVTGPNGEAFPISATYRSGIRTNQEASWLGLGWELGTGEISRQVNGVPDDWKGKTATYKKVSLLFPGESEDKSYRFYGPMYFKDFAPSSNPMASMDLYQSDRLLKPENTAFEFPDYDGYFMSGPGIGGELSPHLFDYASYRYTDNDEIGYGSSTDDKFFDVSNKRMQFRFRNEPVTRINAPVNANGEFFTMDENNSDGVMITPAEAITNAATSNFTGDYNYAPNRMHGGYYVEYFTNSEINTFDPSLSSNLLKQKGFLDYWIATGTRRPSTGSGSFDPDGIGAFKVTTPSGITYHYSLPVYTSSERVLTLDVATGGLKSMENNQKSEKFAVSWKLTAITGLDYEDVNSNGIADIDDKGYWIALEYGLWTEAFDTRFPHYGYDTDLRTRKKVPIHNKPFLDYDQYTEEGSVVHSASQIYFLNTVKTATQTAFFIKEVRLDAHSASLIPKLKLSRIVLLDNEDAGLFSSNQSISNPSANFVLSSAAQTILNNNQYTANKTAIDAASLKTIEFNQDYSLSWNLYNNINSYNEIGGLATLETPIAGLVPFSYYTLDENAFGLDIIPNSGKLTLNEINIYEAQHRKIFPSYVFNYNHNPRYDHRKTDFFGFYKSNATSNGGYITGITKEFTNAWSLSKITTPIGAEIEIEYESDSYSKIGYDSHTGNPVSPVRTFRITAIPDPVTVVPTITVGPDAVDMLSDPETIKQKQIFYKFHCTNNNDCQGGGRVAYDIAVTGSGNEIEVTGGIPNAGGANICFTCNSGPGSYEPESHGYGFLKYVMNEAYGGGIRVKSIRLKDPETNNSYRSEFEYLNSGIATTEPDRFAPSNPARNFTTVLQKSKHGGDRHALPPMIGYTNVEVKNIGQNESVNGKVIYSFINYNEPFSVATNPVLKKTINPTVSFYTLYEVIHVTDGNSNYGQLSEVAAFDNSGNMISHTKNEYEMIGRSDEIFYRALTIKDPVGYALNALGLSYVKSVFMKSLYAGALKKTTAMIDGVKRTTEIIERDAIAGFPVKIQVTDSTNGLTETTTIPAYTLTGNIAMGCKVCNESNKNMLTQIATETTRRNGAVVAGTHTTWANQHPFREFSGGNYQVISKTTVFAPSESFIFDGHTSINDWKKTTASTLYSQRHDLLEQKNIGNIYIASKLGYSDRYKIAQVSNANYSSFTYTGFEDTKNESGASYFDGEVSGVTYKFQATSAIKAHTGDFMVALPAATTTGGPMFIAKENTIGAGADREERGLQTGRTYRVSVWVHKNSPDEAQVTAHLTGTLADGSVVNTIVNKSKTNYSGQSGDWYLLMLDIDVPEGYKSIGGQYNDLRVYLSNPGSSISYFDDFRMHPADASMMSYVYNKKRGLITHELDNENFYTRYVYDEAGQLLETYLETEAGEKILSKTVYKFARD